MKFIVDGIAHTLLVTDNTGMDRSTDVITDNIASERGELIEGVMYVSQDDFEFWAAAFAGHQEYWDQVKNKKEPVVWTDEEKNVYFARKMLRAAKGTFSYLDSKSGDSDAEYTNPYYVVAVFNNGADKIPLPIILGEYDSDIEGGAEPNLQRIVRERFHNAPALLEAQVHGWALIARQHGFEYLSNQG